VPQKSGDKGRWENSARKERRAAQFGNSGNNGGDSRENRGNNREGRKSFHSDRKFNDDRRDFGSNKGRDFRTNKPNNRDNQRGNEKRNSSPVQFSSMRRGK
jgi:hypothetical protein